MRTARAGTQAKETELEQRRHRKVISLILNDSLPSRSSALRRNAMPFRDQVSLGRGLQTSGSLLALPPRDHTQPRNYDHLSNYLLTLKIAHVNATQRRARNARRPAASPVGTP